MELELIEKKLQTADKEEMYFIASELVELKRATNEQIEELMHLWGAVYYLVQDYIQERDRINTILRRIW